MATIIVCPPPAGPAARRRFTPEEDAAIIAGYRFEKISTIARRLGRLEQSTGGRARLLARRGLINPRLAYHPPRWTAAEEELLREQYGETPLGTLARRLGRGEVAVKVRAKRLGIPARGTWLSQNQLMAILGVDHHQIERLRVWGRLHMQQTGPRSHWGQIWRCTIRELERFLQHETLWYVWQRIQDEPWRGMARRAAERAGWLTAAEAAKLVGMTPSGFIQYLVRGDVPAVRVPGGGGLKWRVRRSALAGFRPKRPELVGHRGRGQDQPASVETEGRGEA